MGEQRAGGGLESHMPTHRRNDSATGEEPMPDAPSETRNPPAEPEAQPSLREIPPAQDLPRGTQDLSTNGPLATPVVGGPSPGLSRNPSSCSNNSNEKVNTEYLTAESGMNRRQPPSRRSSPQPPRPIEPPVTKNTLSELDVTKIIHNPKLRHDINYDPELHFRPNLDGEKGRRKQEKANQFWNALLDQLILFVMDRETFMSRYADGEWCLPSLLRAVRDIIETLVPQRDRELLNEGLNVDLLMQQFNRGVADLESLASWLSAVLKLHCAPMRDEWVDEMYQELSNGNRNNDPAELVKGMRSLLSVLEAMKLDVANHQIRCLRPVLIEDTVHFEQRFFMKKIQSRKLSVLPARDWYKAAQSRAERIYELSGMPHVQAFGNMAVFFDALSRLVLPSTRSDTTPCTFVFDEDRILKLRSDMYDSICLEICMRKFEDLDRLSNITHLCSRVPSYVREDGASSNRLSSDFTCVSSRPSSFVFSDRGSAFSSPRSSGELIAQPSMDFAESRTKSLDLYNSLLALLHTAPPANSSREKWRGLADSVALQILRYVNAPPSLPGFEDQIRNAVTNTNDELFQEVEAQFQQKLLAELAKCVNEFKHMSAVSLFSVATGGRIMGASRPSESLRDRNMGLFGEKAPRDPREEAGIDDMAVRLGHLGILHWRVWALLAYDDSIEEEMIDQPAVPVFESV
ncbi:T-complex protein 11-domain-containing protein [Triangularia verruculosa]|uniref:T-complex protein 11-domain-containing protein n=1 Tax=Triangularia verruculosa TaxID=2587418 RepID=A0AAN6XRZ3_9PEZI|nr:T-complex protein 11-domain-containing protein [Triangularia verruculosa]